MTGGQGGDEVSQGAGDVESFTLGGGIVCNTCHRMNPFRGVDRDGAPIEDDMFDAFFAGDRILCWNCQTAIDLWKRCAIEISERHLIGLGAAIVGAQETFFKFTIREHERLSVDLLRHGVPVGADVLAIYFTVNANGSETGSIHPASTLSRLSSHQRIGHRLELYGVPYGKPDRESEVNCLVRWHRAPDEDDGWSHLLDAWNEYEAWDLRGTIVPANIAAEASISAAVRAALRLHIGADKVEDLLTGGATYSHQLNALLPFITSVLRVPRLDGQIAGYLNVLRKLRNDVGHTGTTRAPLPCDGEIAKLLAAAVFGFRYGRFLRARIANLPSSPATAVTP